MTLLKKFSVLLAALMAMTALDDAYAQTASTSDSKRCLSCCVKRSRSCCRGVTGKDN